MSGKDFNKYNYSSIIDMRGMFYNIKENIPNISTLDVSNVTNMESMFEDSAFNQDISNWDVSNVTYMCHMFHNTPFNNDISKWNVDTTLSIDFMFKNSNINNLNSLPYKFHKEENLYSIFSDISKCLKLNPTLKMLNVIKKNEIIDDFELKILESLIK